MSPSQIIALVGRCRAGPPAGTSTVGCRFVSLKVPLNTGLSMGVNCSCAEEPLAAKARPSKSDFSASTVTFSLSPQFASSLQILYFFVARGLFIIVSYCILYYCNHNCMSCYGANIPLPHALVQVLSTQRRRTSITCSSLNPGPG